MSLPLYKDIVCLVDKGPYRITEEEAHDALAVMRSDARVQELEYKGLDNAKRRILVIRATGLACGSINGTGPITSAIRQLAFTDEEYQAFRVRQEAICEEYDRRCAEEYAKEDAKRKRDALLRIPPTEAERQENYRRLMAARIDPYGLVRYVNALAAGRYIEEDDPASDDFGWYCREIVRGRHHPMKLSRFLANFT